LRGTHQFAQQSHRRATAPIQPASALIMSSFILIVGLSHSGRFIFVRNAV
jgi:hypothetical protein